MSYEHPDDDVPVYDPLYPELDEQCAHPKCDNESPEYDRICEKCMNIMLEGSDMQCPYCHTRRLGSHEIPDEAIEGVETPDE